MEVLGCPSYMGVSWLFKKVRWGFVLLNVCLIGNAALSDVTFAPEILSVFSEIQPLQALSDVVAATVVLVMTRHLYHLKDRFPWLGWWIGRLFLRRTKKSAAQRSDSAPRTEPTNLNFAPTEIRFVGPIYLALLMFDLPVIAFTEEMIFRQGTASWPEAIVRSLLFGFVHMLVGVPLFAVASLSVAGLWFSYFYFEGGVELSTLHHTTYDFIVVGLILVMLIRQEIARWRRPKPDQQEHPA